jgi:hypothetical protein
MFWLLTAALAAAAQSAEVGTPCVDWNSRFQQRLTQATAPDKMTKEI